MPSEAAPVLAPRDFVSPDVFAAENAALGQRAWHLLGCAADIPDDGDWFVATLAGRSVFVQRFAERLVGYENICRHRSYPLRTAAKGNGPIACGLHHWAYDADGKLERAGSGAEVPEAALQPIALALCGNLVFGRLPADQGYVGPAGLGDFLGAVHPAIAHVDQDLKLIGSFERITLANWKLCFHLTLDDYHFVVVHPTTLGTGGHLQEGTWSYYALGDHNALFVGPPPVDAATLARFMAECRRGRYDRTGYRIFNIFPSTAVLTHWVDGRFYYVVCLYVPVAADRTQAVYWIFGDPMAAADESAAAILDFVRQFAGEDADAAEQLQRVAALRAGSSDPIDGQPVAPLLGAREQRIGWFNAALKKTMVKTISCPDQEM